MTSAECERMDSLEGWVAVKSNIFEESEPVKLGFIVQWNAIECKFAVTCHNRTLQRQRRRQQGPADTQCSWAGLFSVGDLRNVHRQLTGVSDALEPYFPDLSDFERGNIWDFLFPRRSSGADEAERDVETPCRQLEKYLSAAIDVCGRRIVLDALFAEDERGLEEYFENLQEFRRKAMEEQVARARSALRKILHQHKAADKLVLLLKIYEEEDEAYKELVTVATLFYQYLLQPFRDMRELAVLYKMEILKSMEFEDLGPKRIDALEKEAEDWRKRAKDAVNSIQDITVNYFEETSRALAGMLKQMEEDRRRFGQASWATAAPRLEKLKFMLSKETLQHMRAKEMCLNRRKEEIKEQMESLANQQDAIVVVDELELQYYETQLELYDTKFEILKSEELLLVAQIDTLRRRMKELKEEVVYYDTCEDPEELQSIMEVGPLRDPSTPAVRTLNRQLQQLETKRGAICSRRAYLRNKKVSEVLSPHSFLLSLIEAPHTHSCQPSCLLQKRERKREEEQRRKEWVDQEREKTLSRLRSFRECGISHTHTLLPPLARQRTPSKPHPKSHPRRKLRSQKTSLSTSSFPLVQEVLQQTSPVLHPLSPPPPPPLPPPPPPLLPLPTSPSQDPETLDTPMPLLSDKELESLNLFNVLCAGSMDEVLASLQRGEVQLRRVEMQAGVPGDARESILSAIRLGVKLRKVQPATAPLASQGSQVSDLERSIKAAMQRMKKVSSDSDDEDRGDTHSGEWDS
uniref:WASP homolog associated with actin, golgi membranes and microtubules n=1 Tax=Scleropages formosus TaxID=113540 RepID=A0A8C9RW20_SCLFO